MNKATATNNTSTATPTVIDFPVAEVSPQSTILQSYPEHRPATDTAYIDVFETNNPDGTKSYTVVGVEIHLKPNHSNKLWERFHVKPNQKIDPSNPKVATSALTICCDRLVVHAELCVPECNVAVYAREVDWVTDKAKINTSPLAFATNKAKDAAGSDKKGGDGAHGRHAGSIIFCTDPDHAVRNASGAKCRLQAWGGNGQGAGDGLDGRDGTNMSHIYRSITFQTSSLVATSKAHVTFNPPATWVRAGWYSAEIWMGWNAPSGSKDGPTSGTDAIPSGKPGKGGNGGKISSNINKDMRATMVFTREGKPGTRGPFRRGGSAGTPTKAGHYEVECWHNLFGTDNASKKSKKIHEIITTSGKSYKETVAEKGTVPKASYIGNANAWLHPLAVQKVLYYVRDLFLAGNFKEAGEILLTYSRAMAQESAPKTELNPWQSAEGEATWSGAKNEILALLNRINGHLDFFGNPAGYAPVLSLSFSISLYKNETDRALRTLMLTEWLNAKKDKVSEAAAGLRSAIKTLNEDTSAAAKQVSEAEIQIDRANNSMEILRTQMHQLSLDMEDVKNKLMQQAINDENKKAAIKFGVRMLSATAQVIPYGQPILGSVATSLGDIADGVVDGGDNAVPDTLSKTGELFDSISKARKAAADAKLTAEKDKKVVPEGSDTAKAISKAKSQAKIAGMAGAGISEVGKAISALQVPQSEVDAALQKLLSESSEWSELVEKVIDINAKMVKFSEEVLEGFRLLGDGYARISSNAAAVVTMERTRSEKLGLLDPSAINFIRDMSQRSKFTLTYYLYLVVKTYETTLLKNLKKIEWNMDELMQRINKLAAEGKFKNFTASEVEAQLKVLRPIYQANVAEVQRQLVSDIGSGSTLSKTSTVHLGFTSTQTPEFIQQLNSGEVAELDPLGLGLVKPDRHLAFLNQPVLKRCKFAEGSPGLPRTTTMTINLQPGSEGLVRRDAGIFKLRSAEPPLWSWTVTENEIDGTLPAPISEDILNFISGEKSGEIKQQLSRAPIWSEYYLNVTYNPPLAPEERPVIEELDFDFHIDSSPLSKSASDLCVLHVEPLNSLGNNFVRCSPDDLGEPGRGNGVNQFVRIYKKGSKIKLKIPELHPEGYHFVRWSTSGQSPASFKQYKEGKCTIELILTENIRAYAHWSSQPLVVASFLQTTRDGKERLTAVKPRALAAGTVETVIPMRDVPDESLPIIAHVPRLEDADLHEDSDVKGWKCLNYRGVIGWAKQQTGDHPRPTS